MPSILTLRPTLRRGALAVAVSAVLLSSASASADDLNEHWAAALANMSSQSAPLPVVVTATTIENVAQSPAAPVVPTCIDATAVANAHASLDTNQALPLRASAGAAAALCFQQPNHQHDVSSLWLLGQLRLQGIAVPKDDRAAFDAIRAAAELKDADSALWTASQYLKQQPQLSWMHAAANRYLIIAAKAGKAEAVQLLASQNPPAAVPVTSTSIPATKVIVTAAPAPLNVPHTAPVNQQVTTSTTATIASPTVVAHVAVASIVPVIAPVAASSAAPIKPVQLQPVVTPTAVTVVAIASTMPSPIAAPTSSPVIVAPPATVMPQLQIVKTPVVFAAAPVVVAVPAQPVTQAPKLTVAEPSHPVALVVMPQQHVAPPIAVALVAPKAKDRTTTLAAVQVIGTRPDPQLLVDVATIKSLHADLDQAHVQIQALTLDRDTARADLVRTQQQVVVAQAQTSNQAGLTAVALHQGASAAQKFSWASDHGDATATVNLALLYLQGVGVDRDPRRAIGLLEHATTMGQGQGSTMAARNLQRIYAQGLGVPVDATQAQHWSERAAQLDGATQVANLAP